MRIMAAAQDSLNAQYGASVFSDFAFNGLGILDKVTAVYRTTPVVLTLRLHVHGNDRHCGQTLRVCVFLVKK